MSVRCLEWNSGEDAGSDWLWRKVLVLFKPVTAGLVLVCVCVCVCVWGRAMAPAWICITYSGRVAAVQLGAMKDTRRKMWLKSWIWVYNVLPMSGWGSRRWNAKPLSSFIPLIADMICSAAWGERESLLFRQPLLSRWGVWFSAQPDHLWTSWPFKG